MLETRLIDGAILAAEIPPKAAGRLVELGAPLVACDQVLRNDRLSCVFTDHYASARAVMNHLYESGRRNVVVVVSSEAHGSSLLRKKAAEDFRREHGEALEVSFATEDDDDSVSSGVALGEKILSRAPQPDAVFTGADQLAAGVLIAAEHRGIPVPHQLAIVGFDDQSLSQALGITSVYQPVREMGSTAVDLLIRRIESRSKGVSAPTDRVELPHELRTRRTS